MALKILIGDSAGHSGLSLTKLTYRSYTLLICTLINNYQECFNSVILINFGVLEVAFKNIQLFVSV